MKPRARDRKTRELLLSDPAWRAFILEWERLTDAVDGDWRALRNGFRQLKVTMKSAGTVSADAVDQHLTYSVFDLAVHWEVNPRIVRGAFRQVWSGSCATHLRISAAAHFWAWAERCSPADMPAAATAVAEAKDLTRQISEPLKRENLERMLEVLTGGRR